MEREWHVHTKRTNIYSIASNNSIDYMLRISQGSKY